MTIERHDELPDEPPASTWGWYLYGVTLRQHTTELIAALAQQQGEPVQALEQGQLVAVVKPVPLAEFSTEALRARANDLAWLETMVRGHNQLVEGIHQTSPVLPARFGSVSSSLEALQAVLAEQHDQLLAQLQQLSDCDEWSVHLSADHQAMQHLAGEHPAIQRLKRELATASPGRAYLLKHKLADELAAITEQTLGALTQAGYARLAREALAGEVSARPTQAARGKERALLHAIFLVQRSRQAAFLEEVQRLAEEHPELRCEYSGPWPPYSFVSLSGAGTR